MVQGGGCLAAFGFAGVFPSLNICAKNTHSHAGGVLAGRWRESHPSRKQTRTRLPPPPPPLTTSRRLSPLPSHLPPWRPTACACWRASWASTGRVRGAAARMAFALARARARPHARRRPCDLEPQPVGGSCRGRRGRVASPRPGQVARRGPSPPSSLQPRPPKPPPPRPPLPPPPPTPASPTPTRWPSSPRRCTTSSASTTC
jgi:hypothetical protein